MAIGAMAMMGSSLLGGGAAGGAAAAAGGSGIMGSVMGALGGSGGAGGGLLSMGGSLLSSMTGFLGGGDKAKAMKKEQEEQWKQQMINTREQYRQLGDAETQANKEYGEQLINNQVSLLQQQAQVELMAGASGTGGASISSMLGDLSADAGRNQSKIIDNYENQQKSFINQAKSIRTGGQMQMRSVEKPSAFASAISGVGSAASAFAGGAKTAAGLKDAWDNSRSYSSGLGG